MPTTLRMLRQISSFQKICSSVIIEYQGSEGKEAGIGWGEVGLYVILSEKLSMFGNLSLFFDLLRKKSQVIGKNVFD